MSRMLAACVFISGAVALLVLSIMNSQIQAEVDRLEAELGHMTIEDPERVYIVEVVNPDVPPEVRRNLKYNWQFRCYLPPGYDYRRASCGGRISKDGVYARGGHSSTWNYAGGQATHQLLTVSLQEENGQLQVHCSFDGSMGTSSWGGFRLDNADSDLVVEKLANHADGPRSFDVNAILPLLRVYDANSAEATVIDGASFTSYTGGYVAFIPKPLELVFNDLRNGRTPTEFKAGWLASVEQRDE
ncbi:MAG: hypothetical protein AAGG44_10290 [Planctomycetota bacterium]